MISVLVFVLNQLLCRGSKLIESKQHARSRKIKELCLVFALLFRLKLNHSSRDRSQRQSIAKCPNCMVSSSWGKRKSWLKIGIQHRALTKQLDCGTRKKFKRQITIKLIISFVSTMLFGRCRCCLCKLVKGKCIFAAQSRFKASLLSWLLLLLEFVSRFQSIIEQRRLMAVYGATSMQQMVILCSANDCQTHADTKLSHYSLWSGSYFATSIVTS